MKINDIYRNHLTIQVKQEFILCKQYSLCRNGLLKHYPFMSNETYIKIGGDHGGGSFKMSYQICNMNNPNSKSNTVVFSVFEAKDRRGNLKIGLSRYKAEIGELQMTIWE